MGNDVTFTSSFGSRVQAALWAISFCFLVYLSIPIFGWPDALERALLLFVCHLANFYIWYGVFMPRYYEKKRYLAAFIAGLSLILVLLGIRLFIEKHFSPVSGFFMARFVNNNMRVAVTLFSEISVMVLATLLRFAVSHEEAKLKVSELERMQLESELRFLKAQMNPHFLFNAINNIYALTLTMSAHAPDALLKLSGLLRYMLYECHDKVPLHKEMSALKAYAELFQLRFEEPVDLDIENRVKDQDMLIEPLLLIPLLENACKHSGLGIQEHAYAKFVVYEEGDFLFIDVENSRAIDRASDEPGGIGLANIRKRLQMIYNEHYRLTIKEEENRFIVNLKIPL